MCSAITVAACPARLSGRSHSDVAYALQAPLYPATGSQLHPCRLAEKAVPGQDWGRNVMP